jgi:cyclo(L-leucyl-L-leucyl) synthase
MTSPAIHAARAPMREHGFTLHPQTASCAEVLAARDHLFVGISPFNSRFSVDYLRRVVRWAADSFARFDFLLPDEHSTSLLLQATGTPEIKAKRKARQQLSRNVRDARAAVAEFNYSIGDRGPDVVRFSDVASSWSYRQMKSLCELTYATDPHFREACLDMSSQAVQGRQQGLDGDASRSITVEQAEIAVPYLFAELPFFLNASVLIGVRSSILAYHREWPIGRGIFEGRYPFSVAPNQGYVTLRSQEPPPYDTRA